MEEKMPLVSVAVITYNSSKYVLETLESIKAQTYKNIELIISDDCSKDNTMQLCEKWCEQNKERFARIQVIEPEKNTGVAANCNRAEAACEGDWVKLIAGDDLLLPNCITDFIEYVSENPNSIYVFGRIKAFGVSKEICNKYENEVFDRSFWKLSNDAKLKELIYGRNHIPAPACFYNLHKKKELGLRFDEQIPMLEDWPMWINVIRAGVDLKFMDKAVAMYRITNTSISIGAMSSLFFKSHVIFYMKYIFMNSDGEADNTRLLEIANNITALYDRAMNYKSDYESILNSHSYRLGNSLFKPFRILKKLFK